VALFKISFKKLTSRKITKLLEIKLPSEVFFGDSGTSSDLSPSIQPIITSAKIKNINVNSKQLFQ
jgi:hypothetical protein